MIIITPTDLRANQKKYFDLAETEKVIIKRGRKLIELVVSERLITDEDLANGLTAVQLLEGVKEDIHEIYSKK